MDALMHYRAMIELRIQQWVEGLPASSLYAPMAYMIRLPAKRIRPAATLMACEMFGGTTDKALDPAIAIELFHNFTLMHDDIMDQAPLRRGHSTVHTKWNINTAILSGDAMLVQAYRSLGTNERVLGIFNEHALAVCEGQQSDMEFEERSDVPLAEYLGMIRKKTALLLACALRVGAVIGGADASNELTLGEFGEHLGLAFQLRDDLLDAFGDPIRTGKQPGGDLKAGKKTWILIKALELERSAGERTLQDQLERRPGERDVPLMLSTLERMHVQDAAEHVIEQHEALAFAALHSIDVPEKRKEPLLQLASSLSGRAY